MAPTGTLAALKPPFHIEPDWRWGTLEGSREFDRLLDRKPDLLAKSSEWLEEAETLTPATVRQLAPRRRPPQTGSNKKISARKKFFPPTPAYDADEAD